MRILWITNIAIGEMSAKLTGKPMGGLWMDALLTQLLKNKKNSYIIVTSNDTKEVVSEQLSDAKHYFIPGGISVQYRRNAEIAKKEWRTIFEEEKPDIIQIWGTEYSHSVYGAEVAKEMGIPSVVYIQGVMKAIARYATGDVPFWSMVKYTTIRDIYRWQPLFLQNKWFEKRAKIEEKLLGLSGNIVIENKWAESFCKSINPYLEVYKIPLNINEAFSKVAWDIKKIERHSIMCNASGPAYKGLHILLNALLLVREQYSDVKIYIPGRSILVNSKIKRQKYPGYWGYITDFILKNNLQDNVIFTGYKTQKELAELLSKRNVFVLTSAIENHSSSLKEAMAVGTPSIAAQVGGVAEYFEFGKTGYSFRYQDYECLANYICELFNNDEMCQKFSEQAKMKANEMTEEEIALMIEEMYQSIKDKK